MGRISCAISSLSGPITITAPASMSSMTDALLRWRSEWVSRDTTRRWWPFTPPPALTRSAAYSTARSKLLAVAELEPVKGSSKPTVMESLELDPLLLEQEGNVPAHSSTPSDAAVRNRADRRRMGIVLVGVRDFEKQLGGGQGVLEAGKARVGASRNEHIPRAQREACLLAGD